MEIEKNHKKGIVPSIFICFAIMLVAFAVRVPADVSPYFAEMDSYYYLRLTENIVDHGYAGDEIRDGKNWDTHSCAPEGRVVDTTIGICYLTIVFWRVLNLFFSCSIMTAAYWMGAVLSVLVVIPVYLLARRITNRYGATVAAALVAVGSGYVLHTYPGFYDTDLFNLTIPLTAIVLLMYAISTTNKGKQIILSLASASLIAVFSLCWTGYSFYFVMLIIYLVMISILALLQKKKFQKQTELQNRKNVEINIGFHIGINLFVIICMITFVLLLRGPEMFVSIYQKLMSIFHFQDQAQSGVSYGNVYQSVAELQPPALLAGGVSGLFNTFAASVGSNTGNTLGIINGVGGILSAVCACGAIGTCVYKFVKHGKQYDKQHDKQRNKQHNKEQEPILDFQNEYILLLLWTILSAVAAVKASDLL